MRLIKIDILLTKPKRIPGPFISRHCSVVKVRRKSYCRPFECQSSFYDNDSDENVFLSRTNHDKLYVLRLVVYH